LGPRQENRARGALLVNVLNSFHVKLASQVFEFGNGDVYKGDFLDDDIHGEGTRNYADGGRYVGSFKVQ
jgi:hypothetical protein